jgi:hypothetical protein
VFTFVVSGVIWFILKSTVGIRATEEQEMMGMDMAEVGVEAYPEFTKALGPGFPGPFFVRDALQASERWCSALAHKTAVPKNAPSYSAWVHNNSTVCRSDGLIAHSGGLKAAGLPSGTALDWPSDAGVGLSVRRGGMAADNKDGKPDENCDGHHQAVQAGRGA